jgi:hypothetical protein
VFVDNETHLCLSHKHASPATSTKGRGSVTGIWRNMFHHFYVVCNLLFGILSTWNHFGFFTRKGKKAVCSKFGHKKVPNI